MSVKGYHLFAADGTGHVGTVCNSCLEEPRWHTDYTKHRLSNTDVEIYSVDHEESDSPQHCEDCDALLDHPLTPDGYEYIAETLVHSLETAPLSDVEKEWYAEFGYTLKADGHLTEAQGVALDQLTA